MTLLVGLRGVDSIVVAHDLRASGAGRFDDMTFKHVRIAPGVLALFAGDVGTASAILQRVGVRAEASESQMLSNSPYGCIDVLQSTAVRHYAASYGDDWSDAPELMFLVAGFHATGRFRRPVLQVLHSRGRFGPRAPNFLPGLYGDKTVAEYLLAKLRSRPIRTEGMQMLASLLILESARIGGTVSPYAFIQTIYADGRIEALSAEESSRLAEKGERLSHEMTWLMADRLGIHDEEVPNPDSA